MEFHEGISEVFCIVGVSSLDSACQVQIQSFGRMPSFNSSYAIDNASVGLKRDIAANNLCMHC